MSRMILLLMVLLPMCLFCQDFSLEEKALEAFCSEIGNYRTSLKKTGIYFNEKVAPSVSNVYDIAYCFGRINWQEYVNQNLNELDSIRSLNKEIVSKKHIKIKAPRCRNFNRFPFLKKRKYRVVLRQATRYVCNTSSVLITMYHKPTGHFVLFSVLFNEDNQMVDTCFSSYIID